MVISLLSKPFISDWWSVQELRFSHVFPYFKRLILQTAIAPSRWFYTACHLESYALLGILNINRTESEQTLTYQWTEKPAFQLVRFFWHNEHIYFRCYILYANSLSWIVTQCFISCAHGKKNSLLYSNRSIFFLQKYMHWYVNNAISLSSLV